MLHIERPPQLKEGNNCWKTANAERLSLLIDAQNYYSALLSSILQAKRSILIVGWDFDSRIPLDKEHTLSFALEHALARSPNLEIYVLCWDFAMIYTFERQLFPSLSRTFRHPRIRFELDGAHPPGASHHQKIVAIDEQIAFCGGLDLCSRRWDTRTHAAHNPQRIGPDGKPYGPFHDIQCVVTGEAAACLAEVVKERWHNCAKQHLGDLSAPSTIWPHHVRPQLENVRVGISRTLLDVRRTPDIREVEALYLDSIRRARHFVYIECEYLTSDSVTEAIADRLQETKGPEFVIIVPRFNSGWLEQMTMGVLRNRSLRILREADHEGRLAVYYPVSSGFNADLPISVHSKLTIVDDELLRVGSSNLSNRSMGFDSECDIAFESQGNSQVRETIRRIRLDLLAEHLGVQPSAVEHAMRLHGSMRAAIARLQLDSGRSRDLRTFADRTPTWINQIVPHADLFDPERPLEEDRNFSLFLPKNRRKALDNRFSLLILRLLVADVAAIVAVRAGQGGRSTPKYRAPPKTHWVRGYLFPFFASSATGVPADLSIFAAHLLYGSQKAGWMSFSALMSLTTIGYLLGRALPDHSPNKRNQQARAVRTKRHHGAFWPGLLLHSASLSNYERIAFQAGRRHVRPLPFFFGTAIAQGIRSGTIQIYSRSLENYVERPSIRSLLTLLGTTMVIAQLYRWSSRRVLPIYRVPRFAHFQSIRHPRKPSIASHWSQYLMR